ncbi:MAG: thiamine-phosphate kinase [Gemmatimonadales bacterium]
MKLGPGPEFDRIRMMLQRLGPDAESIGDDCAVIPEGVGSLVLSADLAVEGVHFRRDWLSLEEIGWRAAAAALSDLAAEGAAVVGVLASLGVPADAAVDAPADVMGGVHAAVRAVGGRVLGGDLSRGTHWLINITVLGRAVRPVTRAGARPGDQLWVTGSLGGPRAGLAALLRGDTPSAEARAAFARPVPRVTCGQALARAGATAMLDLSDGLAGDAGHLAAASSLALHIQLLQLPIAGAVLSEATRAGVAPAVFGALGGEDYELLAVLPPSFGGSEAADVRRETGVALTLIGECRAGSGVHLLAGEKAVTLHGFDHFA